MKFSPEEMAYEIPDDTSHLKFVGRGSVDVFAKPGSKATVVQLDSDVAKVFKDSGSVNKALRKLIEAIPPQSARKRKSA